MWGCHACHVMWKCHDRQRVTQITSHTHTCETCEGGSLSGKYSFQIPFYLQNAGWVMSQIDTPLSSMFSLPLNYYFLYSYLVFRSALTIFLSCVCSNTYNQMDIDVGLDIQNIWKIIFDYFFIFTSFPWLSGNMEHFAIKSILLVITIIDYCCANHCKDVNFSPGKLNAMIWAFF